MFGKSCIFFAITVLGSASVALANEGPKIQVGSVKSIIVSNVTPTYAVARAPKAVVDVGDTLPLSYFMVVNLDDYDLPRPGNGWVYFEVEDAIFRVDLNSREVLEKVAVKIN